MGVRRFPVVALAALLVCLPECGGPRRDPPAPPDDPNLLVLRVEKLRSLVPPWEARGIPAFSLYGDGRVIVPAGRQGALLAAKEFRLDRRDAALVYRRARAAGLARSREFDRTYATDASVVVVTLWTVGGAARTEVVVPGGYGAPERVLRFVEGLPADHRTAVGYRATALAVLALGSASTAEPVRPWPLSIPLSAGPLARPPWCTVFTGEEVARAETAARGAAPDTPWDSGDRAVGVMFRPLLPDEPGCDTFD